MVVDPDPEIFPRSGITDLDPDLSKEERADK